MKLLIALTCLLSIFTFPIYHSVLDEVKHFEIANHLPTNIGILPPNGNKPYTLENKLVKEFIGKVSFYNLGDESQNDDSPCIGAFNENLCESLKSGELLFANNYYDKGTLICIDTVGCGRVADRMNSRYGQSNIDVAMALEDKQKALKLGRKNLIVRVYKK